MGRPTKLTPEVQDAIVKLIRLGVPLDAAAAHAGIHPATFHAWRAKGRKAKSGLYHEFLDATKNAEGVGEASLALIVRQAAQTSWQAAMTMMERRWPQRWARRVFKPDDPVGGTGITINFTRPAVDPAAKGDDLAVVGDIGEKPGNGNGGK